MNDAHPVFDPAHERGMRLRELFVRASELPEDARTRFLADACDDRSLRHEVVRLLAEDARAGQEGFLSPPPALPDRPPDASCGPEPAHVGQRVGAYTVGHWIATGGMGSVYRATRVDDYQQTVAIKFVRAGWATPETLRRFANERQVLAELNHPGIARILDAGTTESGQQYFVMEYIEGRRIDDHCEENRLTVRQRVELMVEVCRAVEHAHEHGVVHRDVKPSNILVTDEGIPKLTDFGVARWIDRDSEHTLTGEIIGTPSYISPEQASGQPDRVGPLSDVYSLGTVLYKLLTGVRAFKGDTWRRTIELVCTSDPPSPRSYRRDLPVDLEAIALKCLEKEPHDRYASARALADDLQRWLDGRPVHARPLGPLGRCLRSYRRHRRTTWLAIVATAAVLAGVAAAVWFARHAADQHEVAVRATHENQSLTQLAEQTRRDADRHAAESQAQADRARRLAFNQELARIQQVCDKRPERARDWLADPDRCPPDLRRFAWQHLERRTSRHVRTWSCGPHHDASPAIAFLPGGSQLASLTQQSLSVWNVATGSHLRRDRGAGRGVVFLATSPDGSVVAVPRDDSSMAIYRTADREAVVELAAARDSLVCAAVSNDAVRLAIGTEQGAIELWDTRSSRLEMTWNGHADRVFRLEFTAAGDALVSYGRDREVRTWEVPSGRLRVSHPITGIRRQFPAFSKGGDRLALGQDFGNMAVWDSATGASLGEFEGNGSGVPKAAFSLDGRELACAVGAGAGDGERRRLRIWDTQSSDLRLEWTVPRLYDLAFSYDGAQLATCSTHARSPSIDIWDIRERVGVEPVPELDAPAHAMAWLADARLLCATTAGTQVLDLARSQWRRVLDYGDSLRVVRSSADGQLAAVALGGTLHIWHMGDGPSDLPRPVVFETGKAPGNLIQCIAFSPRDRMVAAGTRDGTIDVWSMQPSQMLWRFKSEGLLTTLAISPDGKTLVSSGRERGLAVWDLTTGRQAATLEGHTAMVRHVAFRPTGGLLASAGRDGTIRFWDLAQRTTTATLLGHSDWILSLAFSPDGTTLASAGRDRTIRLWDAETGDQQLVLEGHTQPIVDLQFSLDGSILASCDEGGRILLWTSNDAEGRRRATERTKPPIPAANRRTAALRFVNRP